MTNPVSNFGICQDILRRRVQREFVERFDKAESQKKIKEVTAQYHLALAAIGIGPDDMERHGIVVPPAANANPRPRPASIPPGRLFRRAGVLMAAAGGFFALSWVYLLIAMVSFLTYYPSRVYRRFAGK